MESFIKDTIDKLYNIYGNNISDVKILLPSSRARLFFNQELASKLKDKPIWQPNFFSVDSLTKKVTSLSITTPFRLVVELYSVYSKYHNETFDKFYYWGDMLVRDFDTIDNYMVDAKQLFVNINDLKVIDNHFDFLDEQQKEMVLKFWSVFSLKTENSKHQKSFLTIWNTLLPIYTEYKELLRKNNIGYKGMIYREAVEKLDAGFNEELFDADSVFVFIGFNALSKSEKKIFKHLQDKYTTHFFWDYDSYYINDKRQEAGVFVRSNISMFGDECTDLNHDNFVKPKEITIINSPSVSLECKYVWTFLEELQKKGYKLGRETAIVLTNEDMLLPVMYSIPESIDKFNVTSGFSISQTSAYSFLEYLIALQNNKKNEPNVATSFYYKDVMAIFNHPYFNMLLDSASRGIVMNRSVSIKKEALIYVSQDKLSEVELCRTLFKDISTSKDMSSYIVDIFTFILSKLPNNESRKERREFISSIITTIETTQNTIDNCEVNVSIGIFLSLLRKHISSESISFMGEPLLGVQVMGILETRNIDFENVLILSVNEDNFPGINAGKSFIPNSLRWGYELPTPYHSEAMYSYYFYRLIQRAKRIHITYCSKSEGMTSGEPSRYIHQLKLESPHKSTIIERSLSLSVSIEKNELPFGEKTPEVMAQLEDYFTGKKKLSASSLYKYIRCPYSFYLRYVKNIKESKVISEVIEATDFGQFVHHSLEKIYVDVIDKNKELKSELKKIDDNTIKDIAIEFISEISKMDKEEFTGQAYTLLNFVCQYVRNVINYDIKNCDFRHHGHEVEIENSFKIVIDGVEKNVYFRGFIDRIDILNSGLYRFIDYKTGAENLEIASIESLFDITEKKSSIAIMQILLYGVLAKHDIKPALYFTRSMNKPKYDPTIIIGKVPLNCFSQVEEQYKEMLSYKLTELFDSSTSFTCTPEVSTCEYCDYRVICNR